MGTSVLESVVLVLLLSVLVLVLVGVVDRLGAGDVFSDVGRGLGLVGLLLTVVGSTGAAPGVGSGVIDI